MRPLSLSGGGIISSWRCLIYPKPRCPVVLASRRCRRLSSPLPSHPRRHHLAQENGQAMQVDAPDCFLLPECQPPPLCPAIALDRKIAQLHQAHCSLMSPQLSGSLGRLRCHPYAPAPISRPPSVEGGRWTGTGGHVGIVALFLLSGTRNQADSWLAARRRHRNTGSSTWRLNPVSPM